MVMNLLIYEDIIVAGWDGSFEAAYQALGPRSLLVKVAVHEVEVPETVKRD